MLDREEYVEQEYFFRVFHERIVDSTPAQEIMSGLREEILATTKLPMAIDFLSGELQLHGKISGGMARLSHYFLPFQTFIMTRAEEDESKFDFRVGLKILEQEAAYRASTEFDVAGLFMYQFECLARNRLGYDFGVLAISQDSAYNDDWKKWIERMRFELGTVDFADMVYQRSEQHVLEVRRRLNDPEYVPAYPILFNSFTGRIANANRGKDPLYMFAALQRQLGFPTVPRPPAPRSTPVFEPQVDLRFQRLENKVAILEQEQKGNFDISKYYKKPE